jgi:DHA2 family methylenomycin A resistance protein-like MFS transporter
LTSTLLGSVDKSRSGIAAGVLNSTRQTGSVLGRAVRFAHRADRCLHGREACRVGSAAALLAAAVAIRRGGGKVAQP